jgi:tRNA A37 threonylcarbamoyladenosine biosynthesis protein TsaE
VMRLYPIKTHDFFKKLVHVDAYRIESLDEVAVIGLEPLMREPTNLIAIEWAERIEAVIPKDVFHIIFSHGAFSTNSSSRTAMYG